MKNWGTIYGIYFNDYEDRFNAFVIHQAWTEMLRNYYTDPKIRLCASTKRFKNPNMDTAITNNQGGKDLAWGIIPEDDIKAGVLTTRTGDYGGYASNGWATNNSLLSPSNEAYPLTWNRYSNVTSAAEVPLFIDGRWKSITPISTGDTGIDTIVPPTPNTSEDGASKNILRAFMNRHNLKVNCITMDLSVTPVSVKGLWHLRWHRNWFINPPIETDWPKWAQNAKEL